MFGVPRVLVRRLHLGHDRRLLHRAEQRVERFARHEIERAVLHLDGDVRAELAVERGELFVRALHAVGIDFFVVDERPPHDDAVVRG
jgi:hypothetical protein